MNDAIQHEYDEMDRLISSVQYTKPLPELPPQLVQLWQEQDRLLRLHSSAISGTSTQSRSLAAINRSEDDIRTRLPSRPASTLSTMSLSELANRCMSEINKYRRKEPHDDQYALEIFHRAMVQHDPDAWQVLHQCFSDIVLGWIRRHPHREVAYRYDSEENYVDQAFRRLWTSTVRNHALEFTTLAGALRFLHTCLNSAIIDTLRAYCRRQEVPWPEPGFPEEPLVEDRYHSHELWDAFKSLLPNEREQRLAYMLYFCGLKPRQIVQYCPNEFSNVREVFRLTRNILDRLRRNKDRLRWLLEDDEG